jgi:hypothetical protein
MRAAAALLKNKGMARPQRRVAIGRHVAKKNLERAVSEYRMDPATIPKGNLGLMVVALHEMPREEGKRDRLFVV